MTTDELLAELRGAPAGAMLGIWWFHRPASLDTVINKQNGWDGRLSTLPDAISETVEFCERMVAIEGCEHKRMTHWFTQQSGMCWILGEGINPPDDAACLDCPAEYHNGKWI